MSKILPQSDTLDSLTEELGELSIAPSAPDRSELTMADCKADELLKYYEYESQILLRFGQLAPNATRMVCAGVIVHYKMRIDLGKMVALLNYYTTGANRSHAEAARTAGVSASTAARAHKFLSEEWLIRDNPKAVK